MPKMQELRTSRNNDAYTFWVVQIQFVSGPTPSRCLVQLFWMHSRVHSCMCQVYDSRIFLAFVATYEDCPKSKLSPSSKSARGGYTKAAEPFLEIWTLTSRHFRLANAVIASVLAFPKCYHGDPGGSCDGANTLLAWLWHSSYTAKL